MSDKPKPQFDRAAKKALAEERAIEGAKAMTEYKAEGAEAETFNDTSNRHLWRVGDGLAGWAYRILTGNPSASYLFGIW